MYAYVISCVYVCHAFFYSRFIFFSLSAFSHLSSFSSILLKNFSHLFRDLSSCLFSGGESYIYILPLPVVTHCGVPSFISCHSPSVGLYASSFASRVFFLPIFFLYLISSTQMTNEEKKREEKKTKKIQKKSLTKKSRRSSSKAPKPERRPTTKTKTLPFVRRTLLVVVFEEIAPKVRIERARLRSSSGGFCPPPFPPFENQKTN